jgi:hypothetical protein
MGSRFLSGAEGARIKEPLGAHDPRVESLYPSRFWSEGLVMVALGTLCERLNPCISRPLPRTTEHAQPLATSAGCAAASQSTCVERGVR